MNKIFYLHTCSTCQRIIKSLEGIDDFEMQDIKSDPLTAEQLDMMKEKVGSYEALFSRRAMKYRGMGLHEKDLSESDYRKYILGEYTFLKRPVIIVNDEVFVGNSKKTVEAAQKAIRG